HASDIARVSSALNIELFTPLGRTTDTLRHAETHGHFSQAAFSGESLTSFHSLGISRVLWPRRQLLHRGARRVCRRLVQRWLSKDAKALQSPIQEWVAKQWQDHGMTADQLIARFQEAAECALTQSPEAVFASLLAPIAATRAPSPARSKSED